MKQFNFIFKITNICLNVNPVYESDRRLLFILLVSVDNANSGH